MDLPIEQHEIDSILAHFPIEGKLVTAFHDSSRYNSEDTRWNIVFDDSYVLKINSVKAMWEERLQEISRLIARYRSVGVYCPAYLPALNGGLSCLWEHQGQTYVCYVEEFAKYPACGQEMELNQPETVEHLGKLAAEYTNIDLTETRSMWSIIDLAPLDTLVDEKQENADLLTDALRRSGFEPLAEETEKLNCAVRSAILPDFRALPRCVYQGDLNSTNVLHDHGCFAGLIDFNMSGTDVNINVFLNETNWFPDDQQFDELSIDQMMARMDIEQQKNSALIFKHYQMNSLEKKHYPHFKRIVDLFQYPNVCTMIKWLENETRRDKCARLIKGLIDKPF